MDIESITKIKNTIGLLSSMVSSGEGHSDSSKKAIIGAMEVIDAMERVDAVEFVDGLEEQGAEMVISNRIEEMPIDALVRIDETYMINIADLEGDVLHCNFNNDRGVQIHTGQLSYICPSADDLHLLIELIEKTEKLYKEH